jgi:acetylornithine deacetylase/succinyl-diaminopimelate desuccinylase-like protein
VGRLQFEPGAVNVVPARVLLSYDVRAPDRDRLAAVLSAVSGEPSYLTEPVAMSDEVSSALRAEISERGLPVVELASGAGHDAAVLAGAGVPSAMLFVRSLNGGASHSPAEESSAEDVALAIDVLAVTLSRLADAL